MVIGYKLCSGTINVDIGCIDDSGHNEQTSNAEVVSKKRGFKKSWEGIKWDYS